MTMASRQKPRPEWFKDKLNPDRFDEPYSNTVSLFFPKLPIVFHTIEDDERRWIPKKHVPIIVNAWSWAQRRRGREGWGLYTLNGVYTDKKFPHCYSTNSCLRPAKVAGDYGTGIWPINTLEDYERARSRIIQLLGGINLESLLTGMDWDFDPRLVLPAKLYTKDRHLDTENTCDYYSEDLDWQVAPSKEETEEDDDA